jgi:TonB family protein
VPHAVRGSLHEREDVARSSAGPLATDRAVTPPAAAAVDVIASFPGLPAPPVADAGVRVGSVVLDGRAELATEVRDAPELGATLITVGDLRTARPALPRSRRGGRPSEAPASSRGVPPDPQGAYAVRPLVGSASDLLAADEHVLLGEELDVVERGRAPFAIDLARARLLEEPFGLRSIVALDTVWLDPEAAGSGVAIVALAGGKRYRIVVSAAPSETGEGHQVAVDVSRALPGRDRDPAVLRTRMQIDGERAAVLAIPDGVLARDVAVGSPSDWLFIGLSPQFAAAARPDLLRVVENPDHPPVLIEGDDPRYPAGAAEHGAHGVVELRALVGWSGEVEGVTVVDLPRVPGAEHLAAAAAGAVRRWRYMPARHRGEDVAAYVAIALRF